MVEVFINGSPYQFPSEWSEVTLYEAQAVFDCGLPAKLKQLYDSVVNPVTKDKDGNEIEPEVVTLPQKFYNTTYPKWIKSVIMAVSDVDSETLKHVSQVDRREIYDNCLEWIVLGVRYDGVGYSYQPTEDEDPEAEHPVSTTMPDEHGKQCDFFYPPSIRIMGKERPTYQESFITYTELDDLLSAAHDIEAGNLKAAALCAAIMLRKKDEVYDENTSLRRSLVWAKSLTMQDVWAVFFCTQKQLILFSQTTLLREKRNQTLKHLGRRGFLV
tara:strand:- start:6694 stop:7506 length:813 start_codon:yes stop_codon:yes gene_type:complete